MADDDFENDDPPKRGLAGILAKITAPLAGLTARLGGQSRPYLIWGAALVVGIIALILVLNALGDSLSNNEKKQVQVMAENSRAADQRREAAIKVEPLELTKLLLPNMLDRLEHGDYSPVFPPKPQWSISDFAAYLPELRQIYLEAMHQKNQHDLTELLSTIE